MCKFFSFVIYKKRVYYINAEQRKECIYDDRPDSHSFIAEYHKIPEDKCNKYEYTSGNLIIDQINNVKGLSEDNVAKWMRGLIESGEFDRICLEAVKQAPHTLKYIGEQTPEICLEAVKRDGHTLVHVKEQTPEICLAAVKRDGYAVKYIKEQTPEICLEAVKRDSNAIMYVKYKYKYLFK